MDCVVTITDARNGVTTSAYDKRGNLILEEYIKDKKVTTAGEYTHNGLGALMENTWIIVKNGYGYDSSIWYIIY